MGDLDRQSNDRQQRSSSGGGGGAGASQTTKVKKELAKKSSLDKQKQLLDPSKGKNKTTGRGSGGSLDKAPPGAMKRIPWDKLPPGSSKSPVTIIGRDGSRMSQWDYDIAQWRKQLKAGKVSPQSREEICDWVQDPNAPGKWIRAWDPVRQAGWFSSNGKAYRQTSKLLEKPEKLPKGAHIISPTEAKGDGSKIPEAKLQLLLASAVKTYIKKFKMWQPMISYSSEYPVILVNLIAGINQKLLRERIGFHIWGSRQAAYINTRTYDDSKTLLVAMCVGPMAETMKEIAHSCAILALYKKYRAALPAILAKHKAKHTSLAGFVSRTDELAVYLAFLKTGKSSADIDPNMYMPAKFKVKMPAIDPREFVAVGSIVSGLVKP